MENKIEKTLVKDEDLKKVAGGSGDGAYKPWIYDPNSPIEVVNRHCPDCGADMGNCPNTYPNLGYDVFKCPECYLKFFLRTYIGDKWYRAYDNR